LSRHLIFTKTAVRVYESKAKALSTHVKPLIAVPISAVVKVERVKFDTNDDVRFDKNDGRLQSLKKNMFEI